MLTRLGIRVVYEQAMAKTWYFFDPARKSAQLSFPFRARPWPLVFRADRGAVVIFDPAASGEAVEPLMLPQFTVATASPNRSHFKEFVKRCGEMRYFPPWSLPELLQILPFSPLDGDRAALEERFAVVGGVPRKIFGTTPTLAWELLLTGKLSSNVLSVRSLLSRDVIEDFNQAHNDLVTLHGAPPSFDQPRLELASDYVRLHYPNDETMADRRHLSDEIRAAFDDPTRSVEAGKKFESFVRSALIRGGYFPHAQILKDGSHNTSLMQLREFKPMLRIFRFADLSSLDHLSPGDLFCPANPNFPLVDFFAIVDDELLLFQVTVASTKPSPLPILQHEAFLPLFRRFASASAKKIVKIFYVVPQFSLTKSPKPFRITELGELTNLSPEDKDTPLTWKHEALGLTLEAAILYLPIAS